MRICKLIDIANWMRSKSEKLMFSCYSPSSARFHWWFKRRKSDWMTKWLTGLAFWWESVSQAITCFAPRDIVNEWRSSINHIHHQRLHPWCLIFFLHLKLRKGWLRLEFWRTYEWPREEYNSRTTAIINLRKILCRKTDWIQQFHWVSFSWWSTPIFNGNLKKNLKEVTGIHH